MAVAQTTNESPEGCRASGRTGPAGITVYFDGSCPLCSVEVRHYAAQPGAEGLCFLDVSRAEADPGPGLTPQLALQRFHVRLSDGRLISGARAFVSIWERLPRWRWAARLARLPGMMPVLEAAYRIFLPIRPVLSRIAGWFGARQLNPGPASGRPVA
jgi:predicted DCC family thiol-disulfide oxidoreductase YuxK